MVLLILASLIPAGLALVATGLTRAKNATHTGFMIFFGSALAVLGLWAVGFGVMTGGGFLLRHTTDYEKFFWRAVQASIVVAIPAGALAERWSLKNFFGYSLFAAIVIFPVAVRGSGWVTDIAGAGSVHVLGGFSALAGAIVIGPRIGRYNREGGLVPIPAHNVPLALLGCGLLMTGWLGFNSGQLPDAVARLATVTLLAGAAGAVAAATSMIFSTGRPDPTITMNGLIAGLVASSAAVAHISPAAGVIIGGIAGFLVSFSVQLLDRLRVDDPIGAISVHGVAGLWGVFAAGLFANRDGVEGALHGGWKLLSTQALGGVALAGWACGISWVFFMVAKKFLPMRVPPEVELEGLDLSETGVVGYPEFQHANAYGSGSSFGAFQRK